MLQNGFPVFFSEQEEALKYLENAEKYTACKVPKGFHTFLSHLRPPSDHADLDTTSLTFDLEDGTPLETREVQLFFRAKDSKKASEQTLEDFAPTANAGGDTDGAGCYSLTTDYFTYFCSLQHLEEGYTEDIHKCLYYAVGLAQDEDSNALPSDITGSYDSVFFSSSEELIPQRNAALDSAFGEEGYLAYVPSYGLGRSPNGRQDAVIFGVVQTKDQLKTWIQDELESGVFDAPQLGNVFFSDWTRHIPGGDVDQFIESLLNQVMIKVVVIWRGFFDFMWENKYTGFPERRGPDTILVLARILRSDLIQGHYYSVQVQPGGVGQSHPTRQDFVSNAAQGFR